MHKAPQPGDFVVHAGRTALVHSSNTRTCMVMPATPQRGAARVSDVDIGALAFSTIRGPIRVSILSRVEWPANECIVIGRAGPAELAAIRLAALRTRDNFRIEAETKPSVIFETCKPSFRSGGRKVGAHVS